MEASHSSLAPKQIPSGAAAKEARARAVAPDRGPALKQRRLTPEGVQLAADDDVRLRMRLQRRSLHNLRRHVKRAVVRVSVLVAADFGAFVAMRSLLRLVRDYGLLGWGLAHDVDLLMPKGALTGWQFPLAMFLTLLLTGTYGEGDRRRSSLRLFISSALAVAVPLNWAEPWRVLEYLLTTVMIWVGMCSERLTIDQLVAMVRSPESAAARAVFVGPAEHCRRAARMPVFACRKHYRILGFVDACTHAADDALGPISELARLINETDVEAVVICGHFEAAEFTRVVDTVLSSGCELVSVPRTVEIPGVRPAFVFRDGEPLVTLTTPALKGQQLIVKRAVDLLLGAVGLLVASPLLPVVAAAVRLGSTGPVFFSQERVGLGGRKFRIWKFRTMGLDAEQRLEDVRSQSLYGDPRLFKAVDDPRVTRVGRWLRKTSLDELPQLWNVVRGEMSLVGPRPPLPSEVALYESHHYARFDVKPGITGPWQVNGRNRVRDFEEVVKLETSYIRDWSILSDLRILLHTIPVVARMEGAH